MPKAACRATPYLMLPARGFIHAQTVGKGMRIDATKRDAILSCMRNLLDLLDHAALNYGAKRCAVSAETGVEISFQELLAQSERVAAALANRFKIKLGAHVAMLMPNCLEVLPIYFGIHRAGGWAIPVNARLKAEELEFILTDCEAQALFVHPGTWKAASGALAKLPTLTQVVAVGFETPPPGTIPLAEFLATPGTPPPRPNPGPDDVAAVIYTSGTTGRPKGAMLTHGNVLFNIQSTKAGHKLRPDDVHLLSVPLFHVTGLNTIMPTALDQGAPLVVSAQVDPEDQFDTIAKYHCTTCFGVPTTYYLLTSLKNLDAARFNSLRLICYSGAPMSPLTIKKLRELFPRCELHNFFGLTETTSVSTVLPDNQALSRSESVGLPPPGLEAAIFDANDQPLPPNAVGELVLRGPSIFKGYYKRDQATADALRGGWFHTGDTAMIDVDGYVYLRGRQKEMLIVAGENVYPIEVENALCAHPAVQEAAVFARPDPALGEIAHAAVVLRPGQALTERELKAFVTERLAAFKVPRTIKFLPSLPRNPSGKVMKRDL